MSYLNAVEQLLSDASRAGVFQGLKGEGEPLDLRRGELAGDAWLGNHLLENERLLPPWLQLARDIEDGLKQLAELDATHAALAAEFRETRSEAIRRRVEVMRGRIETLARRVRAQQDQFNLDAPGRLSERPGIWVEYLLEKVDARVAEEGADGSSR